MTKCVLYLYFGLLSAFAISGELEVIAEAYLEKFKENMIDAAVGKLHCPESYSKEELDKDLKSIAKTLSIFVEEFGVLKSYSISKNHLYVAAMTACGTTKYWEINRPIAQLVYETRHEDNRLGYIVFSFSKINDRYVLAFVHHGVPMVGETSINKIKHVLKRISSKSTN